MKMIIILLRNTFFGVDKQRNKQGNNKQKKALVFICFLKSKAQFSKC